MPADERPVVRDLAVLALASGLGLALAAVAALLLGARARQPGVPWDGLQRLATGAGSGGLALLAAGFTRPARNARSRLPAIAAIAAGAAGIGCPAAFLWLFLRSPLSPARVLLGAGAPLLLAGAALWRRRSRPSDPRPAPVRASPLAPLLFLAAVFLALVLPSSYLAVQRTRQRRTLGDLRSVMVAAEAYSIDHESYPETASMDALAKLLSPAYLRELPRVDGWGWPIDYLRVGSGKDQDIYVRSPGADGLLEHPSPADYPGGTFEGFDRDIVFTTARRSQFPEGTMAP